MTGRPGLQSSKSIAQTPSTKRMPLLAGAVGGGVEAGAGGIQQIELLYRQEGEKGPGRTVTIASKQTLIQQELSKVLELEQLFQDDRG